MKPRNFLQLTLAAMCAFSTITMRAQVTIGSVTPPKEFSVLELISGNERGLRLPQLTTAQRNAMQAKFGTFADTEAVGLQIFNMDTRCVEVWNGLSWISMCNTAPGTVVPPPHFDVARCGADNPLRNFTAVRLTDGLPHPQSLTFQGAAGVLNQNQIHFNMMPVTGGVYYRGAQSTDPNGANYIAPNDPFGAPHALAPPVHQVAVNSFFIAQSQVTRELFMAVMAFEGTINGHTLNNISGLLAATTAPVGDALTTPTHPRNNVNWYEAIVFANRLSAIMGRDLVYVSDNASVNLLNPTAFPTNNDSNQTGAAARAPWDNAISKRSDWLSSNGFRLPTEAEWEYAARGGQQNEYTRTLGASGTQFQWSGSNDINAVAWWSGNSGGQTHPVMLRQPNELGIFDMTGNLWDYCWDWLSTYDGLCFLTNPLGDSRNVDGTNTAGLWNRVHRGGAFNIGHSLVRVSTRGTSHTPARRVSSCGFRIASSTN